MARSTETHPDCVFPKPEFTALPLHLSGGVDSALIQSRDEPYAFDLGSVEFGRKAVTGLPCGVWVWFCYGPRVDSCCKSARWTTDTV